ncbi:fasciclin domain-containing protein [Pedobacter cryophilus]|uniref:Fasciclin domain-containing protein n=1 Tax=Pedobacter cryophilus TaxID=2571271 RepID=A0A4V5NZA9_9SPHI|nr:fasciclin domain-containing protein [Pedobacter cryophilus]TKB96253.1 fasciclin domain-containing protein [Pedobacter cryophilus]
MRNIVKLTFGLLLFLSVLAVVSACRKSTLVYSVSNRPNITRFLQEHPDEFSELSKVLNLSGTASFLDAYGSYTLFAPNNTAIKAYLQTKGKTTVEEISGDEWKSFVRFHLLEDSIGTEQFTDGKLPQLTMFGQYLITGSESANGQTKIRVNRQANITASNISVGNGLIHTIDNTLTPASLTIAQILEANGNYVIFTEALKKSGLFETLNVLPANNPTLNKKFLTLIAETDDVLKDALIYDYDDLKRTYSNTGDPTLATDSLHLFLEYHILYEAKYLADIITSSAHHTLAPLEVLTAKLSGESVLINDDYFNGTHEVGIELPRNTGDISATNGVVHNAAKHFGIKLRSPYRVDFDVCTFPELLKNKAYYGVNSYEFTTEEAAELTEVRFSGAVENKKLIYRFGSGQGTSKTSYNVDVLIVPMATGGTSSRPEWVEFKTPLLIRGKYKIWIGYYTQAQSSSNGGTKTEVQALIGADGSDVRTPLSNARTLNFVTKRPGQPADVEEAIGWKTYMENTSGSQVSRLMGIADIPQTGRYWIRLKAIDGSQTTNNIDLIQFIPINDNQQYPKFKPDGTLIPKP